MDTNDLWAARKARARAYLKTRQYKWTFIGKDERGRDKYLSVDTTTYHYDKEASNENVPNYRSRQSNS